MRDGHRGVRSNRVQYITSTMVKVCRLQYKATHSEEHAPNRR